MLASSGALKATMIYFSHRFSRNEVSLGKISLSSLENLSAGSETLHDNGTRFAVSHVPPIVCMESGVT